ncbi:MAG: hypothetical protein E5Y89_14460, partial [Mesorhizobium sp.]
HPTDLFSLASGEKRNCLKAWLPFIRLSGSLFHGTSEPLYLFVLTQFRTENRFTLFLELP